MGDHDPYAACFISWNRSLGTSFSNNIGVQCGGGSSGAFALEGGSGTMSGNRMFSNNAGSNDNAVAHNVDGSVNPMATGVWHVMNNSGDTIHTDGSHGGEWCGAYCAAEVQTNNTWGAAADGGLTGSSTIAEIEAVLGAAPLIPPLPKNCVVKSPFSTQTSLPSCP
jgi:hypothetical protein